VFIAELDADNKGVNVNTFISLEEDDEDPRPISDHCVEKADDDSNKFDEVNKGLEFVIGTLVVASGKNVELPKVNILTNVDVNGTEVIEIDEELVCISGDNVLFWKNDGLNDVT
jgi:hypothetical protein